MFKRNLLRLDLTDVLIASIGVLAFTQVTIIPGIVVYVAVGLLLLVSPLGLAKTLYIDKELSQLLLFFVAPSIVGLCALPIAYCLNGAKFNYEELSIYGRIINLCAFSSIILLVDKYSKDKNPQLLFRWYNIGLFVLIVTGVWQALSIYTPFISFPFQTRDALHTTYGITYSFVTRVTGIASEPSYFSVAVVDFIVLSTWLYAGYRRIVLVTIAAIVLILSLSPSGYVTLIGGIAGAYVITAARFTRRITIKRLLYACLGIPTLFTGALALYNVGFLKYVLLRITDISVNGSGRLFMNVMPFVWSSHSNVFSFLFGHGIKSYSIIGTQYVVPNGEPVAVTSNNFFVDMFWESGIVGLFIVLAFFGYLLYRIMSGHFMRRQMFFAAFVWCDIVLSSFVRADFASARLFIMVYLLYQVTHFDFRESECCLAV